MTKRIAILVICIAACGGGSDPQPAIDAESSADAFESDCGFPGDVGNELGIGKFCASIADLLEHRRGTAVLEPRLGRDALLYEDLPDGRPRGSMRHCHGVRV
jgi:hypothetical protein